MVSAGLAPARVSTAWLTETTARGALAAAVLAGLALVGIASAARSSFVPPSKAGFEYWMVGPLRGLSPPLPAEGEALGLAFSALLAIMLAAYLIVLACGERVPRRAAIAGLVALHAVFLLGPPLTLTDVFNYLNYANLAAAHGINPYAAPPAEVPVDPAYAKATWHNLPSPYGPLFTLGTYPLTALPLPLAYWVLKLATAAASLGCLALVWRIAPRVGRAPLPAVLALGLNPLVLVYGLGGVHNDFFVGLALLAGVGALTARHAARGGAALVAAAALKPSAGLALPFAWLGSRQRSPLATGAGAAAAALAAISLAAFGWHVPGLQTQSSLATPLSPLNLLGVVAGQGGATGPVRVAGQVALAVALIVLAVRTARGAAWLQTAGWATLALVLSLPWVMPWYVVWVLPLAVLSPSRRLRRATLALTVFLVVSFIPVTGYLLEACGCSPADTRTGKENGAEIRRLLR
jgi:hypothetical protein